MRHYNFQPFVVLILLLVSLSCNEDTVNEQENHVKKRTEFYTQLHLASLRHGAKELGKHLVIGKDNATLKTSELVKGSLEYMDETMFDANNFDYLQIASQFENSIINYEREGRIKTYDFPDEFSYHQTTLATDFLNNLQNVEDLSDVPALVASFYYAIVINRWMSEEEKDVLFSMGASAEAMAQFFLEGGVDIIYQQLEQAIAAGGNGPSGPGTGGRTNSCSVNMRDVWGGAVVGLAAGAVNGAITGCAGGTVAFPLLGTVTGCVGGAVLGGASGFIGGALAAVATSLLLTCFR